MPKKFNFEKMTPSDILINCSHVEDMTSTEKIEFILALRNKLNNFHTITVKLEEDVLFRPVGELCRQALNS